MAIIRIPYGINGIEEAPAAIINELSTIGLSERGTGSPISLSSILPDAVEVYQDDLDMTKHNIAGAMGHMPDGSVVVGGSQLITVACFSSFLRSHPGAGFVLFDAHPDCNPAYSVPDQKDVLLELIEEGIISPQQIVLVGTRAWTREEKMFLDTHHIKSFFMKDLFEFSVHNLCDSIMEKLLEWPSFYLSIDMDVVDPAFAPGVDVPEPGGMSSREILYIIQRLRVMKNFGMAEVVEVNPKKDVNGMTVRLAARVVRELVG